MDGIRAQIHENLAFLGTVSKDVKIIISKDRPGGKYVTLIVDIAYRADIPLYYGKPHHTIQGSMENLLEELAEAILQAHPCLSIPQALRFDAAPRFQGPSSAPLMQGDFQDPFVTHRP